MNRSDSIGQLAAALAKAQAAMEHAIKDSRNPHFGQQYAGLTANWDACREPLAANEIAVIQSASRPEAGLVGMTTLLIHSSGEWIESDLLVVQAKDAGPQAVGSCNTYLRRYQLAGMVGIAPVDDDAEQGEGRAPKTPDAKPEVAPVKALPRPAPKLYRTKEEAAAAAKADNGTPLDASGIPF